MTSNAKAEATALDSATKESLQAVWAIATGKSGRPRTNDYVWKKTFEYDANGNRSFKVTAWGKIPYSYGKENELLRVGAAEYTYDLDGNLVREVDVYETKDYEYDGKNRAV